MSSKLIGRNPNQLPSNADLGTLAYQNSDNAHIKNARVDSLTGNFTWNNDLPTVKPVIMFDFVNGDTVDPRLVTERSYPAHYYDGKTYITGTQNLVKYSEEMDQSPWDVSDRLTVSSTVATTAPDGSNNAWKLAATGVAGYHDFYQSLDHHWLDDEYYTTSIFVKAAELDRIALYNGGGAGEGIALFNATTGEFERTNARVHDYGYRSYGNGWYRIWQTRRVHGSAGRIWYISVADENGDTSFTGTVGDGVYIWGGQVEKREFVTAYHKTTNRDITTSMPVLLRAGTHQARIDHDPLTGQSRGLLVESTKKNYVTHKGTTAPGQNGITTIGDYELAPDGTKTAWKVVPNTSDTYHYVGSGGYTTDTSTYYTASIYAKAGEYTHVTIGIWDGSSYQLVEFNLTGDGSASRGFGTEVSSRIENVGGGWYRCQVSRWLTSGLDTYISYGPSDGSLDDVIGSSGSISPDGSNTWFPKFAGDGFSGAYFWGAQIEEAGAASSFICDSNEGAAVIRDFDNIYLEGKHLEENIRPEEQSFLYEGQFFDKEVQSVFLGMGNPTEGFFRQSLYILNDPGFDSAPRTTLGLDVGGGSGQVLNVNTPRSPGLAPYTTFRYAATHRADYFAMTHTNADEVVTINSTEVPVFTGAERIGFGQANAYSGGSGTPGGYVRRFAYYANRLSDKEMIALVEE